MQKCGYKGHFQTQCRTRAEKRNQKGTGKNAAPPNKRSSIERGETVDYIFHIDDDNVILSSVCNVEVEMIIDSGRKCNILNDSAWQTLKKSRVQVSDQVIMPDKKFLAYGSNRPLTVLGSFVANLSIGTKNQRTTFL